MSLHPIWLTKQSQVIFRLQSPTKALGNERIKLDLSLVFFPHNICPKHPLPLYRWLLRCDNTVQNLVSGSLALWLITLLSWGVSNKKCLLRDAQTLSPILHSRSPLNQREGFSSVSISSKALKSKARSLQTASRFCPVILPPIAGHWRILQFERKEQRKGGLNLEFIYQVSIQPP